MPTRSVVVTRVGDHHIDIFQPIQVNSNVYPGSRQRGHSLYWYFHQPCSNWSGFCDCLTADAVTTGEVIYLFDFANFHTYHRGFVRASVEWETTLTCDGVSSYPYLLLYPLPFMMPTFFFYTLQFTVIIMMVG